MSKLRFQIALPIVQFIVAVVLLEWGRRVPQPAGLDFPYSPTMVLVCKGISAPAALFSFVCASALPLDRPDRAPVSILGIGVEEMMFLLGVVAVWYFVGRAIDHRGKPRTPRGTGGWRPKTLLNLALMLLGLALLLVGITPILDRRGFTNPGGTAAAGILWMIWSLVLFWWSGMYLVRGFRSKTPTA